MYWSWVSGLPTHYQAQRIYQPTWPWLLTQPYKVLEISYKKHLLQHLIRTIQSLLIYTHNISKPTQELKQLNILGRLHQVREGCPLSLILLYLHTDEIIRKWHSILRINNFTGEIVLNMFLFPSDQTQKIIHKELFIHHILLWENTISESLWSKKSRHMASNE